jgi:DNA repair exonuclease SbcCD ATPase subunit
MFGNAIAMQRAMELAMYDTAKLQQQQKRLEQVTKDLDRKNRGRKRIMRLAADDKITDTEADEQLDLLNKEVAQLEEEKAQLSTATANRPNKQQIKAVAEKAHKSFERLQKKLRVFREYHCNDFDEMTYEEKRGLCQLVFSGKSNDNKRLGVYIHFIDANSWRFSIRGHLLDKEYFENLRPLRKETIEEIGEELSGNHRKQKELLTKSTAS